MKYDETAKKILQRRIDDLSRVEFVERLMHFLNELQIFKEEA